ncbi:uncharacterized protein LOC134728341 [Mytilus trossulus]|uniref:uncharacterized protein LOC134728341 n=1 Tax=Mytilus trossulus TaxID=6551 RepID=UPI003003AFFB
MSTKRFPVQRKEHPRIEVNVLKVDADGNSIYDEDFDSNVCHCFPSTSSKFLPSMIYDELKCDHEQTTYIQPAQQSVFTYPWTANTVTGREDLADDRDSLKSGKLSAIAEEPDGHVTRTAPPFASPSKTVERTKGPYSAPVDPSRWESHGPDFRRAHSEQSVNRLHTGGRPRTLDSREFRGRYVDPKDGQVYKFNVNYGKRNVQASRQADNTI